MITILTPIKGPVDQHGRSRTRSRSRSRSRD